MIRLYDIEHNCEMNFDSRYQATRYAFFHKVADITYCASEEEEKQIIEDRRKAYKSI